MPFRQLDNPKGAFYGGVNRSTAQPFGQSGEYGPEIQVFRNASTSITIQKGMPVVRSTLSSRGDLVAVPTTAQAASALFVGIALTSAGLNTSATTVSTAPGLGAEGSDWCQVAVRGVVHGALLSSAVTAGDVLVISASTGTTASGTTGPGSLGAAPTTQGTAGYLGVAGIALSSGTTGSTGWLTTAGPRGIVDIQKSIVPITSV